MMRLPVPSPAHLSFLLKRKPQSSFYTDSRKA